MSKLTDEARRAADVTDPGVGSLLRDLADEIEQLEDKNLKMLEALEAGADRLYAALDAYEKFSRKRPSRSDVGRSPRG